MSGSEFLRGVAILKKAVEFAIFQMPFKSKNTQKIHAFSQFAKANS